MNLSITLKSNETLVGGISMDINQTGEHGELGYYIGKPYWNNGYATEATQAVIRYSFEMLGYGAYSQPILPATRRQAG